MRTLRTGGEALVWRYRAPLDAAPTGLAMAGDGTIVTGGDYEATGFRADGTRAWHAHNSLENYAGAPTPGQDGSLFLFGSFHTLFALEPTGTLRWTVGGPSSW